MTTQISGDTGVSQCQQNSVSQFDLQFPVVGRPMYFGAQASAPTTLVGDTNTKVLFQTPEFGQVGIYDIATSLFKPTTAGLYLLMARVRADVAAQTVFNLSLVKNGSLSYSGPFVSSAGPQSAAEVSVLIYLNGTTGTVEVRAFVGVTANTQTSFGETRFQGILIGMA